jgi:class 3 adenylate cyclase
MAPVDFKRKLTALLCAEIKAYSRPMSEYEVVAPRICQRHHGIVMIPDLMGEENDTDVRALTIFQELIVTIIQKHQGKMADSIKDNLLAEFSRVEDAIQCAAEIQQVLRGKNVQFPEHPRIKFRIGINLGEIMEGGGWIYEDGVIATQIINIADEGGICISESVHKQIGNKLPYKYEFLGEYKIEKTTKPVRVYRAQIEAEPPVSRKK